MTPTKAMQAYIDFARFCASTNILPMDAAIVCQLAARIQKIGAKDCNNGTDAADLHRRKLDELADALGFNVEYPGLWPTLIRQHDQREFIIPALR